MYSEICSDEEDEPTNDAPVKSSADSSPPSSSLLRWTQKHADLQREVMSMSEEKSRKLFNTERERQSWIDEIRSSVERNIQSQVRAVLGTPPTEKRKKLYEERKAAERRRWQLEKEKANVEEKHQRKHYSYALDEEDDMALFRRQQYLHRFNSRRTMRAAFLERDFTTTTKNSVCLDPLSDSFNKSFSPYTRAALESVDKSAVNPRERVFRRVAGAVWIDHNGTRHELPGPYWPKDHLPVYPNQSHIHCIPRDVEPLNTPTSNQSSGMQQEPCPYPRQWRGQQVVYDRQLKQQPVQRCIAGSPPGLVFESRFECGNLRQAKRIGNFEYDLVLNTDLYTKRHTQWYYFCVQGMIPGVTYKLNIVNLLKKDSLYNYGMKPLLYSETEASQAGQGWIRTGHHIDYHKNVTYRNNLLQRNLDYHTLTFQLEFPHAGDTCYLAHCYPYTYTDLELYLRTIVDQPHTSQHVRKEVLCQTVAGNNCYVLTITSSKVPDREKLGVVLSARVHPGETNASWMMKGMMDFLTSGHPVAEKLRRKFVFKVVPMLNPDGVIVGNYRTNLAARDLNRTYREPNKENFPTVWHTKAMLEMFKQDHEVIIYCDLHGHSRKPNVFMYGCTNDTSLNSMSDFVEERLFPWMMSQKAPDKFSFSGCKFRVRKCKESTARVVMWRQLGIPNSFTMEATFCGANFGEIEKGRHFNIGDFEAMGRHFCEVLLDYSEAKCGNGTEMTQAFVELACKMTRDILKQTLGNFHLENLLQKAGDTQPDGVKTTAQSTDENHQEIGASDPNRGDLGASGPPARGGSWEICSVGESTALRSARVDSFNDCMKILEGLNLADQYDESDSSDSDSDVENDDSGAEKGRGDDSKEGDKKKKKKKKKKAKHWWETLSKPVAHQEPSKSDDNPKNENTAGTNSSSGTGRRRTQKKVKMNVNKFVNPYNSRSNGGIPIFSQERILERARKKENQKNEEKRDFLVKFSDGADEDPTPLYTMTEDAELNFITAQRRLAYYMLSRNAVSGSTGRLPPHKPVARQPLEADSFRFDYLSSGEHGFSIRIPSEAHGRLLFDERRPEGKSKGLQSFEEARRDQRTKVSPAYAVDLEDEHAKKRSDRTIPASPWDARANERATAAEVFSRHISNLRRSRGHAEHQGEEDRAGYHDAARRVHSSKVRLEEQSGTRDWRGYGASEETEKSHSAGASTRMADGPEFVPSVLPAYYSRYS